MMNQQRVTATPARWIVIAVFAAGVALAGCSPQAATAPVSGPQVAASQLIAPKDYVAQFANTSHFLLDVRTPEEFNGGHIANAANISVETLASRLGEVPKDQPIVLYCRSGNRSAQAAQILINAGYKQVYDMGGIITWQAQGFPIQ